MNCNERALLQAQGNEHRPREVSARTLRHPAGRRVAVDASMDDWQVTSGLLPAH